jgi:hypothetical protein
MQRFRAKLTARGPGGSWVFLPIPASVSAAFGSKARVPVTGTINDFPFRSSLIPEGGGAHYLAINKGMQAGANAGAGDTVTVAIELDLAERVVAVPPELEAALNRAGEARTIFESLSYSHRKEYADWVESAKRSETRLTRADRAVELLRGGQRLK